MQRRVHELKTWLSTSFLYFACEHNLKPKFGVPSDFLASHEINLQINRYFFYLSVFLSFLEYIAMYTYESSEQGDLTFQQGDLILVTKKDGDWWTGTLNDKSGVFPSNYVRLKDSEVKNF